jgi:redox-sensitive bicupin YhaK (pirin superfamily)
MISVRKAEHRGRTRHGSLEGYHTFSFAEYFDPHYMGFRSLRVLNEERLAGGRGTDPFPVRDIEVVTYVISGALMHHDSLGHSKLLPAGAVQRMSAGTGVEHSESNLSSNESAHFLQIWLYPDRKGVNPDYAQASVAHDPVSPLTLVCSADGRSQSIRINQDADVYVGRLGSKQTLAHPLAPDRYGWIQVIAGDVMLNGRTLSRSDGAAVQWEQSMRLSSERGAHFLLFDLR